MSPITHDDQVTLEAQVCGGSVDTMTDGIKGPMLQDSPAGIGHKTTTCAPVHRHLRASGLPGSRSQHRTGGDTDQREGHVPGRTLAAEGAWQ